MAPNGGPGVAGPGSPGRRRLRARAHSPPVLGAVLLMWSSAALLLLAVTLPPTNATLNANDQAAMTALYNAWCALRVFFFLNGLVSDLRAGVWSPVSHSKRHRSLTHCVWYPRCTRAFLQVLSEHQLPRQLELGDRPVHVDRARPPRHDDEFH